MTAHPMIVPFRGDRIELIDNEGTPCVPMRAICEALGLDWKSQHRKLSDPRWASTVCTLTTVGGDGRARDMVCLPLHMLPAWLFTVSPAKVAPHLKDKVTAYQTECADVLWSHWSGARQREVDALAAAAARMEQRDARLRGHLLAANGLWGKAAHLQAAGVARHAVWRFLSRSQNAAYALISEAERAGAIDPAAWSDERLFAALAAGSPDAAAEGSEPSLPFDAVPAGSVVPGGEG